MTTQAEAAKALEKYGWSVVKYAQYVQKGNVFKACEWRQIVHSRRKTYDTMTAEPTTEKKMWFQRRTFTAGTVPLGLERHVDIWWGEGPVQYRISPEVAPLFKIKAWKYSQ